MPHNNKFALPLALFIKLSIIAIFSTWDSSNPYTKKPTKMNVLVDSMDLQARSAAASQIPTNRFQQQMLAVIYVIAALAYVAYGLRMYSRISTKQTGLGKHEYSTFNLRLREIIVLITRQ